MNGLIAMVLAAFTLAPQANQQLVLPADNLSWIHREESGDFSDSWWLKDCEVALRKGGLELIIITNFVNADKTLVTEMIDIQKGGPVKIEYSLKHPSGPLIGPWKRPATATKTLFEERFKEQAKQQLPRVVQEFFSIFGWNEVK